MRAEDLKNGTWRKSCRCGNTLIIIKQNNEWHVAEDDNAEYTCWLKKSHKTAYCDKCGTAHRIASFVP